MTYQRLVVVGGPGSGKTTVARAAAQRLNLPHVELDALWWGPNWTPVGPEELTRRVREAMSADHWVFDGNYLDEIGDVLWPAAEAIVWLDAPRALAFCQAVLRTTRRVLNKKVLWSGNRETLATIGPRSLIRLFRRWPEYPQRVQALYDRHVTGAPLIRLQNRAQVKVWLEGLTGSVSTENRPT